MCISAINPFRICLHCYEALRGRNFAWEVLDRFLTLFSGLSGINQVEQDRYGSRDSYGRDSYSRDRGPPPPRDARDAYGGRDYDRGPPSSSSYPPRDYDYQALPPQGGGYGRDSYGSGGYG